MASCLVVKFLESFGDLESLSFELWEIIGLSTEVRRELI